MKFILVGDSHYTNKRPISRLDKDYGKTCLHKWFQIFCLARDVGAYILQAGDLFDSARLSIQGILPLLRMFLQDEDPVYTVPGQHDLWYHNPDRTNTPMGLMEATGAVEVLGTDPTWMQHTPLVHLYGAGWGEEIPIIQNPDAFNILVTHRMVIADSDAELWKGQEEYTVTHELLRETRFDIILSGDNHQSFCVQDKSGRAVVNPGSLMRSTIAQSLHHPSVFILDTETRKLEKFELGIAHSDEVMDYESHRQAKEADERLETFISGLGEGLNASLNFRENMAAALKKNTLPKAVRDIIDECLKEGN